MRPVPNEGHSNAAHWHTKWKAADAELNALRRQLAEAEAKLVGAQERTQILFEAKIKWADRAHAAEAKLALAELNLRLANSLLAEVEPFIGWTGKPDGMSERVAEYLAAIAAGEGK